ncbi:MAG: SGNH/GDSL hydrolase family protein [Bacteroidota bacterium]
MKLLFPSYCLSLLLIVLASCSPAGPDSIYETEPHLLTNKRVLILGNSITQNGTYVSVMEYLLREAFPNEMIDIISIGLGSETVSCLTEPDHPYPRPCVQERLQRALDAIQPEVVLACYGMNDGIYHPQSEERMGAYQAGIMELLEATKQIQAQTILISPPVFDSLPIQSRTVDEDAAEFGYKHPYKGYDQVLGAYASWLNTLEIPDVQVVDLHTAMKAHIQQQRQQHPTFSLAGDGVHPTLEGHILMAQIILNSLGLSSETSKQELEEGLLYKTIAHRRQLRSEGWLAFIGYIRGDSVQSGDPAPIEAQAEELTYLIQQIQSSPPASKGSFGYDADFLRIFQQDAILLEQEGGEGKLLLSPAFQGRVMSSTAQGYAGKSHGWMNYDLIASGKEMKHINVFGGEERFWLGPEGGQYSIFFEQGSAFTLDDWQTPRLIDLEPFEVSEITESSVTFSKQASLTNYADFTFELGIERTIELLSQSKIYSDLGLDELPDLHAVGYRSTNTLTNTGTQTWKQESGLLSIWLLGMFNPSPKTTIVVPFQQGPYSELGPIVNDTYFGKVPEDRLIVGEQILYFSGDGEYRSKIGLSPARAKNVLGSYDAENEILTILTYSKPEGVSAYVNSLWEIQDEPYAGDVINSYNDGPPEPGAAPLGPFYELETSSPALALAAGESGTHIQSTYHFEGAPNSLDRISRQLLGVSLDNIEGAFE